MKELRDFYSHSDSKQNGWNARRPVLDDEAPLASVPLEPLTLEHLLWGFNTGTSLSCEVTCCLDDCVNSNWNTLHNVVELQRAWNFIFSSNLLCNFSFTNVIYLVYQLIYCDKCSSSYFFEHGNCNPWRRNISSPVNRYYDMMKNPQLGVSAVVLFIKKKKEYFKCHFQQFLPHAGDRGVHWSSPSSADRLMTRPASGDKMCCRC